MSEHMTTHRRRKPRGRSGRTSEQMEPRGRVERHEVLIMVTPEVWDAASVDQWYRCRVLDIETGDWVTFEDMEGRKIRRRVWGRITGQEAGYMLLNFNPL